MKNKYNNKKHQYDGYTFDSTKEYNIYLDYKYRSEKLNEFQLIVKPVFEIMPSFKWGDKTIRRATIQPDFLLIYQKEGDKLETYEVQDVKGWDKKKNKFRTTEKFNLQWKLLTHKAYERKINKYEKNKESIFINRLVMWKFTLI